MEKKKLLLVAMSVGVFLMIVVGASLLIFAPRPVSPPGVSVPQLSDVRVTDPRGADPGRNNQQFQDAPPVRPTIPETEFTVNGNRGIQDIVVPVPPVPVERQVTITVPPPRTAAVPVAPAPVAAQRTPAQPARPAPAAPRPAAPAARPAPAQAARPAPARPAETRPPAARVAEHNVYWIQTGAFSTKVRAERSREELLERGLSSIINITNINGRTWYRVRIGPWQTQNEANYWLALVRANEGYAESQVRVSRATR